MCLQVSYKKKIKNRKILHLEVTELRSRVRSWIRIRIRYIQIRIRIRAKMARIPNTEYWDLWDRCLCTESAFVSHL
jgi:hypothetical protein